MSTRSRVRFAFGCVAVACLALVGTHVFAQTASGLQSQSFQDFASASALPSTPLPVIIARLIRAVLGVMGILLTCLIVYAGFLYMTAGGDGQKTDKAKNIIRSAIIGLVIVLSSFAITQFILSRLESSFGLNSGITSSSVARYTEPLGGALNGKVIQDHYPARNALDIPRNAKVIVTFVDPIAPKYLIEGFDTNPAATKLNAQYVKIFRTERKEAAALTNDQVQVSVTPDHKTFVFRLVPPALLGDDTKNSNYSVVLKPGIRTAANKDVFTGTSAAGYAWTFEVSTKVDLTPPQVVSAVPTAGGEQARNTTIELTFNEPMDPTSVAGAFRTGGDAAHSFTNMQVAARVSASPTPPWEPVSGTFEISNGYRTVGFTTEVACAEDDCGNTVYCLPGQKNLRVLAKAATIDTTAAPQALVANGAVNGATDAAGNSLDGNADGKATGPAADDFSLAFATNDAVDDRKPAIERVTPEIGEATVNPDAPIAFTFNMPMKSSTLTNTNVQLWPDPSDYTGMWFVGRGEDLDATGEIALLGHAVQKSRALLLHPPLVRKEDGGHDYYPVVTSDVRGNNQFCYFWSRGPASKADIGQCSVSESRPYCCDGQASAGPCVAPKASQGKTTPVYLPDTTN